MFCGSPAVSAIPQIMVAPTGARLGTADHPALPLTITRIVRTARDCFEAGAGGIHAHVRDAGGRHVLDVGLYRELLVELATAVPGMLVQVTTEAVGRYSPEDQRRVVRELGHGQVSIALREMTLGQSDGTLRDFYHWANEAGVRIQHILYSPGEVRMLEECVARGTVPEQGLELLFVLGRYGGGHDSRPEDLPRYLRERKGSIKQAGWAVCAFGRHETDCLVEAVAQGGKARIGFENNLYNRNGDVAASNSERVLELVGAVRSSTSNMSGSKASARLQSGRVGP